MSKRYRFECSCSEECGHQLGLIFGAELVTIEIESKDNYSEVFIDRATARRISELMREWLEKEG